MIDIKVFCSMCKAKTSTQVELPDGFSVRHDELAEYDGFCAEHAEIRQWISDQCPGCVSCWGECNLWRAFAYEGSTGVPDDKLRIIGQGVCPYRIGGTGTLEVGPDGVVEIGSLDLSDRSSAGPALVEAIKNYRVVYGCG